MEYDYKKLIEESCGLLPELKGKVIEEAFANIVGDEINVVHLKANGIWYTIQGEIGSEIIGVHKRDIEIVEEQINEGSWVGRLPILSQFLGCKVVETRQIGKEWNGHGFEFSFEKTPEKTLIIQSIYTGSEPKNFNDCLRVGVGNYIYEVKAPNKSN